MSTDDFLRKYADDEAVRPPRLFMNRSASSSEKGAFHKPKPIEPMNPRHPFAAHPEIPEELKSLCAVCGVDCFKNDEYYMVFRDVWHQIPLEFHHRQLCIGCLEETIGRKLDSKDFSECPLNYCISGSERLMDRLGKHFRLLDDAGYNRIPIELDAALEEYERREALSDERQRIAYAKVGYSYR